MAESKTKKKVMWKDLGSKNLRNAKSKMNLKKLYTISDAIQILKDSAFVKFDQTLDVAINLGVDPKHSDQLVRGVAIMPSGTGKKIKVAVICKEDKVDSAIAAGADIAGGQEIIDTIKLGNVDYDSYIATPDMMAKISQVARILGPKGLMPNPKLGTVTMDVTNAVKNIKSGQVEFRTDKAGIIHAGVAKLSFAVEDISKNLMSLLNAVIKSKPSNLKGTYMKSVYLSATMSPSLQIDVGSLNLI